MGSFFSCDECSKCNEHKSNVMLLRDEIEKYKYQIYILQNDIDKLNDRLNIRNYMYNVKF
jgi:peptidoglycan hydrolase CwlO-like protein